MKNKKTLPYIIAISATLVAIASAYSYYKGRQDMAMSLLTIISCLMVAMGQYFIIKSKK